MSGRQERDFEGPPPGNPDANQVAQAERVLAANPDFRYAAGLGWLRWDGTKWAAGAETVFTQAVIANAKRQVVIAPALPFSQQLASRRGIEDVAKLATTLPAAHVGIDQLDTHLDYLHTAGKTWHLSTGAAWATPREELNTRALAWEPKEECPEWRAMLDRCFPGESDTVDYLQRLIGYGITGRTTEQIFVLLHGRGANGKSTFMDTLSYVFGPYVETIPVEILMNTKQRDGEAPAPQLAKMRGARIVLTSESERGGLLSEPTVKLLTGDEPLTARTLYREPVTFRPEALILMATNHMPDIRGTDDGIWRRVKLIEWRESFIGRRDTGILDRLKSEAPGIISWALDGAMEWYRNGLQEPARVTISTDKYREDSDFLGSFMPEWLEVDAASWLPNKEIGALYAEFAEANQLETLRSTRTLYRALEERGATSVKRQGVMGYRVRRARQGR